MRKSFVNSPVTFFLAAIVVLSACNSSRTESEVPVLTGEGSEVEQFSAFYRKFHQDSLFQIARISWPLNGNYVQDSTGQAVELGHELADWTMHRPFSTGQDFVQEFQPLTDDLIIEEIKARAGKYKIERRFARLTGGWHLIYYNVSGI